MIKTTVAAAALCMAVTNIGMTRSDIACKHIKQVVQVAKKYNFDPVIFVALINVESNWNRKVVSKDNACGLTQVVPRYSKYTCEDLKIPKTSIKEGARMFNYWYHRYGRHSYTIGLCGYNKGHRCKGENPNKNGMRYANKVLNVAKKIRKALK